MKIIQETDTQFDFHGSASRQLLEDILLRP